MGRAEELGLSVEVVHRTPKPIPEKIARIWAEEWAKEGRETTGKGCFHVEALRSYRGVGWWNAPSLG